MSERIGNPTTTIFSVFQLTAVVEPYTRIDNSCCSDSFFELRPSVHSPYKTLVTWHVSDISVIGMTKLNVKV